MWARSKTQIEDVGFRPSLALARRCYLVSGLVQFSDHFREACVLALGAHGGTALFIANPLVQDLPNETAQAVSNGPDRLVVFQARLQTLKNHFKNACAPQEKDPPLLSPLRESVFVMQTAEHGSVHPSVSGSSLGRPCS